MASSRASSLPQVFQGVEESEHPRNNKALAFLRGLRFVWCGTRRTVVVGGARFSAGLEFGGKIWCTPNSNYK
jgi:hypothetical protein